MTAISPGEDRMGAMETAAVNPPKISREMGLLTATGIVIANIIGAGIFTTSGILADLLPGPLWVIGCWIAGGLIAIAGALCYAELATRMPEEGGEYVYLSRLYHPSLGFLTGWTSFFVGFSAPIAASAMGSAEYLFAGLHGETAEIGPAGAAALKKGTAVALILIFTLIHYRGLKAGSRVQNVLTAIKIIIVLGLSAAGFWAGGRDWSNLASAGSGPFRWVSIGTAMMLVMFAYSGWNASAYIAGELRNPRKTLVVSLLAGTGIVIILYLAMNLFVFQSLPYQQIKGVIPVVERASVRTFGPWMGNGLSVMVGIALLSSLSAFILIGPRVYFAMARDRLFFPLASSVHPNYGVPSRSIAMQGALAVVMALVGSFEQLLIYLGFALGIFPWLAVAGVFIARKRGVGDASASRIPGYPLVPVFFLASTLGLMIIAYINRPLESTAAVMTVLAGIPCYFLWVRGIRRERA